MKKKIILSLIIVFAALIAVMATSVTLSASATADQWYYASASGVDFSKTFEHTDQVKRTGYSSGNGVYDYKSSYTRGFDNSILTNFSRGGIHGFDSGMIDTEGCRKTVFGKMEYGYGKASFDERATSMEKTFTMPSAGSMQYIYFITHYNSKEYGFARYAFK